MRALLIVLAALLPLHSAAIGPYEHDVQIRQSSEQWMPGADWKRFRALLYQESRFNADAVSPAGAQGVAQFMPGTWEDVAPMLGYEGFSPFVPEVAIDASAFYLSTRINMWTEPRPYLEQRRLGEASYNAGAGNILRAQSLCRDRCCPGPCRRWNEINVFLPAVTGHHAEETIDYIIKIEMWRAQMELIQ